MGLFCYRYHGNVASILTFRESHMTIGQCEKGPITTCTDIFTGVELGSKLTDEDVASADELTIMALDATVLGI